MVRAGNKKVFFFAAIIFSAAAALEAKVELGIDILAANGYALLKGKRVGLVTNQTGVDSLGNKTRLLLHKNCNLVALYTPEHGLDGKEKAGRYVKSRRDRLTGVMAYSLYGPTRKPTREMLRGLDVLVFDMQDIGCRSYTYISTMGKCMEAAGENGIPFVVLDRPNPLGGVRIEGPSVEPQWTSFVSAFPVPYVHGLTVGELAKMANAKGWNGAKCELTVVPMRGWTRNMTWRQTGLRWVQTSPNIPHGASPLYYVATGLVGELQGLDTGVGGSAPFESVTASWLNAVSFTTYLRSLDMPGVSFQVYRSGRQQGSVLRIDPDTPANLTALGIYMLAEMNRTARPNLFARTKSSKLNIFFKCYGCNTIRTQLARGMSPSAIVASWKSNVENFRAARSAYLLY